MIDIKTFLKFGRRPNLSEVDMTQLDYKTVDEVMQMNRDDVLSQTFAIVCNNPVWVAQSIGEKGDISYYSNDGSDTIFMATGKREGYLRYGFTNQKLGLLQTIRFSFKDSEPAIDLNDKINKKFEEEKSIMANNELDDIMQEAEVSNTSNNELDDIMQEAEKDLSANTKPMQSFGETNDGPVKSTRKAADPEAKEKKQAERDKIEQIRKKIKDDLNAAKGQKSVELSILTQTWKKHAELICFIAPTDKRQSIAAVKIPVKAENRKLIDSAPDDIQKIFMQNPASVSAEWIKVSYEIKARESKPGRAVGVVIRVPAYLKGYSTADYIKDLATAEAKKAIENDDTSTAIELNTMSDFEQKLNLAGSSIREAKETAPLDGKPGEIRLLLSNPSSNSASSKGVLKDAGMVFAKKMVKVGQGTKTPMHDRNYLPLTTYETVDITKSIAPDMVADLNKYTFESLFTPAKNSKQLGTKHANLIPDCKMRITKKGDDITSDYITNDANRLDLTVTSFYDKSLVRSGLALPIKKRSQKPDGSLGAPQFVKYNVTLEDKMSDPEYRAKSSLGNGNFQHIIDVVGTEILSPSVLKEKFKRTNNSGSVSKYLNADIARDIMIAKMNGGLDNYSIAGFNFE